MGELPQQVSLDRVLEAIEKNRTEIGRELGAVKKCVGETREDMAGLRQLVADHVGSEAIHPPRPCPEIIEHKADASKHPGPPERPCPDLRQHVQVHRGEDLAEKKGGLALKVVLISVGVTSGLTLLGVVLLALARLGAFS